MKIKGYCLGCKKEMEMKVERIIMVYNKNKIEGRCKKWGGDICKVVEK